MRGWDCGRSCQRRSYLSPGKSFSWIGTKGPFGLTDEASNVYKPALAIAVRLGADLEAMRSARWVVKPRADLMHKESGVVIEVDEVQHFTSHRLATFDYYPVGKALGFDVDEYSRTCQQYSAYADKAWAGKTRSRLAQGAEGGNSPPTTL